MASRLKFTLPSLLLSIVGGGLFAVETQFVCEQGLGSIPEDGRFYLRLFDATKISTSFNKTSSTCPADDQRISDLSCMCGDSLKERENRYMDLLNSTCQYYKEDINNINSSLSFCERSLKQLGQCVTFNNQSQDIVNDFDASNFKVKLEEIKRILRDYSSVLHRTIVRVYLPSEAHRCQCLEYYKRWLCATKLPFYSTTRQESNMTPVRVRPSIDVCHSVLQACPYYLPSRFQPDSSSNDSDSFKEVIYGGYPAFDCPRLKNCQENSTYACHKSLSFGENPDKNQGLGLISYFILILFQSLFTLCVLL